MKTRKRGGRLEVVNGAWGFPVSTKWGDKTTDDYRVLELKVFTDLRIPITLPNSTEVLRNKVLVQRYQELCDACTEDACYSALNDTKKEIRKIIKLRTLTATKHFKEVETEQDEIDRVGHEGRLELWRSNYRLINDLFQELRKRLKKPYEVDTDILANDRLTIGEKKEKVTRSLTFVVDDIGSIDKEFSVTPFAELQVDIKDIIKNKTELQSYVAGMPEGLLKGLTEIIKNTTELQSYVAGMPEGLLKGLTEIMQRTADIEMLVKEGMPEGLLKGLTEIMQRTADIEMLVKEGDRKLAEIKGKLSDLIFMFEKRLPRVLEMTTAFNEAVRVFSFSNPFPEVGRFSESLEQFIRDIEEEMKRSKVTLEVRRIKLDGILQLINKEEDELLEEARKEKQLEVEEQERVKQEVLDDRKTAKQDRKQKEKTVKSQDEVLEEEYQLALQRKSTEPKKEPAEEPKKEPAEEPKEPAKRVRKAQIYKEKQSEYDRVTEDLQKRYLEQGTLIKDATDIDDLIRIREDVINDLETTDLTDLERKKREKLLEKNLSLILKKNPSYLELVKVSDEKLKEIFKLGLILSELEHYLQEHSSDIDTEEERLSQFKEDISGLSRRDFLTRLVDKEKLYRDVTERIQKLKKSQQAKQAQIDKTLREFNGLTSAMSEDTKHHIENWSEILKLFSRLPDEEKMGEVSADLIVKLIEAKDQLSKEPYNLTPVVVSTIERYIIQKNTKMDEITEIEIMLKELLIEEARLTRELEILKSKKGGTRRAEVAKGLSEKGRKHKRKTRRLKR